MIEDFKDIFCSKCGSYVPPPAKFCSKCGTKLERKDFWNELEKKLSERPIKKIIDGITNKMLRGIDIDIGEICNKCKKESSGNGDYGIFYYGIKTNVETHTINMRSIKVKTTYTSYKIFGNGKRFFCNECINQDLRKFTLTNIIIFLIMFLLFLIFCFVFFSGIVNVINDVISLIGVFILIPFTGIVSIASFASLIKIVFWRDYRKKHTDRMAIRIKKDEMGKKQNI